MFVDTATIEVIAGKGGDGRLSFRHEKYRALGGPDGGDGGRGGSVIFRVDHNVNTLSRYRNAKKIRAENGEVGGENRKHGKNGSDDYIAVPLGTQVWSDGNLIADMTENDQETVVARGGRGGFGNAHFTSSTRQAPRTAELGEPGESRQLKLELKLIADVGLVGLPNAGKSTLLSVISNAKPEIADYPFTTLVPNLGVVDIDDYGFLVADIPGLIEGASHGKGLGDEFLRHIERTAVLLHLVDATSPDPVNDYGVIQKELAAYEINLSEKPQLLVLTKIDAIDDKQLADIKSTLEKVATKTPVFAISAQAHTGVTPVLRAASKLVRAARQKAEAEASELPVIDIASIPEAWEVVSEGEGVYRVTGSRLEGFAKRTNFDQDDAVERLRNILRRTGVARELKRQGIKEGDTIRIAQSELAWLE
jgi:GTP-binding protein